MANQDRATRWHRTAWLPTFLAGALVLATGGLTRPARADDTDRPAATDAPRPAVGFSNLVLRLDGKDSIGLAEADLEVFIIEALRERGINAVGFESLVFGKDHSEAADFLLGGTIKELACQRMSFRTNCRIGIDWQVLDVEADEIVYEVMTRHLVTGIDDPDAEHLSRRLVLGALASLLKRERFHSLLAHRQRSGAARSTPPALATFRRCDTELGELPDAAERALEATVLIRSGKRLGSGFFISPDGLILTAAHVVDTAPTVELRDGRRLEATLVRASDDFDVALLHVATPAPRCLRSQSEQTRIGADVYVIGAPAGAELAFTLTRGIVSGLRVLDGRTFLQTDASINPGNSGGPLLSADGEALAVASFKLAGLAVEGIAFGVPIGAAQTALALQPGEATDPLLAVAMLEPVARGGDITDLPDPIPALDPTLAATARSTEVARWEHDATERARDERRVPPPPWVRGLRWGGLASVATGGAMALATVSAYDPQESTRQEFRSLRWKNDIGWLLAGTGAAAFVASFALEPRSKAADRHVAGALAWGPAACSLTLSVRR